MEPYLLSRKGIKAARVTYPNFLELLEGSKVPDDIGAVTHLEDFNLKCNVFVVVLIVFNDFHCHDLPGAFALTLEKERERKKIKSEKRKVNFGSRFFSSSSPFFLLFLFSSFLPFSIFFFFPFFHYFLSFPLPFPFLFLVIH